MPVKSPSASLSAIRPLIHPLFCPFSPRPSKVGYESGGWVEVRLFSSPISSGLDIHNDSNPAPVLRKGLQSWKSIASLHIVYGILAPTEAVGQCGYSRGTPLSLVSYPVTLWLVRQAEVGL